MSRSRSPHRKLLAGAAAGVAVAVLPASACGPFFPNQLLLQGDSAVLWAPVADFRQELARLLPMDRDAFRAAPPAQGKDAFDQTATVEFGEIAAALDEARMPAAQKLQVLEQVRALRTELNQRRLGRARCQEQGGDGAAGTAPPQQPIGAPALAELPPQFALYLRGMVEYGNGRGAAARGLWAELLNLPEPERRQRTLWATFMTGRSLVASDPAGAAKWFRRVRELARQGAADPLGLAASSLGWEARCEWEQRHYVPAIGLYVAQRSTGDPTAVPSLQEVACSLFKSHKDWLKTLAADPTSAAVLTAYVVGQGGPFHARAPAEPARRWLDAIEAAGTANVVGADRLAWAAYQLNDIESARRWLARSAPDAPVACWVRSRLLLREGRLDEAADSLAKAARLFPPEEEWQDVPGTYETEPGIESLRPADRARAELGVLELSRGQFVESLDLLLRAGWWLDAAYVAERVLTPDELMAYVNRTWPELKRPPAAGAGRRETRRLREVDPAVSLRWLLARRLTRIGRWRVAVPYFPAEVRPLLDQYVAAIRAGHDERLADAERAKSLWSAAKIARQHGIRLLATELAPDSAETGGSFPDKDGAGRRGASDFARYLAPSPEELRRTRSAPPAEPDKRWHYRYTAADHAWAAAELMPDDADELARHLCEAGSWLKADDPDAADRFYKALVLRCPGTELGKEAARLHWFPKTPLDVGAGK